MALIKTAAEIEKMRTAGRLAAEVLLMVKEHLRPGISTLELDDICHRHIVEKQDAIPAPLNYHGFPKSICTSVNHVICHGIPGDKQLKKGDLIGIDISLSKDGYFGDTCQTFIVGGEGSVLAKRLLAVSQECLYLAIAAVKPGLDINMLGKIIQNHAEKHYFSVVREYCGHGIGESLHESELQVLHYYDAKNPKLTLEPNMTFTIEPMINAGKAGCKVLSDKWTVVTRDRSLSSQFEHTLCVTKDGCEVLTLRPEEKLL
jgi:methionyl aminopeptidase